MLLGIFEFVILFYFCLAVVSSLRNLMVAIITGQRNLNRKVLGISELVMSVWCTVSLSVCLFHGFPPINKYSKGSWVHSLYVIISSYVLVKLGSF